MIRLLNISSLILVIVFMCGCGISGTHDVILVDLCSNNDCCNTVTISFKVVGYESICRAPMRLNSESSKEFYNELRNELKLSRAVRNDSIRVITVDWDRRMILNSYNMGINDISRSSKTEVSDVSENDEHHSLPSHLVAVYLVILSIICIIPLILRYFIDLYRRRRGYNIEAYNNQTPVNCSSHSKYSKIRDDMISRGYSASIVDSVIDEVDKYE